MYVCVFVCAYVFVCVHMCVRARVCVRACTRVHGVTKELRNGRYDKVSNLYFNTMLMYCSTIYALLLSKTHQLST